MSSRELKILEKKDFIKRFAEVCGSDEPAAISRLLDISYQAARNYMDGRIPDANILLGIAEKTEYSIHWLLTGMGEKFVAVSLESDDELTVKKIRTVFKEEFVTAIHETFGENHGITLPKTVVLNKDKVLTEKSREKVS